MAEYEVKVDSVLRAEVAVQVGPQGDPGDPSQIEAAVATALASDPTLVQDPIDTAIATHKADVRPHIAAESGKDFAAWFTAQVV